MCKCFHHLILIVEYFLYLVLLLHSLVSHLLLIMHSVAGSNYYLLPGWLFTEHQYILCIIYTLYNIYSV